MHLCVCLKVSVSVRACVRVRVRVCVCVCVCVLVFYQKTLLYLRIYKVVHVIHVYNGSRSLLAKDAQAPTPPPGVGAPTDIKLCNDMRQVSAAPFCSSSVSLWIV